MRTPEHRAGRAVGNSAIAKALNPRAAGASPIKCFTLICRCRYNNDEGVAGSFLKSAAKLLYYYMYATMYGFVGGWANVSPKPSSDPALPLLCRARAAFGRTVYLRALKSVQSPE